MRDLAGLALVLVLLGALMGFVRAIQHRCSMHPEIARKSVHVGMGVICLGFPWLFTSAIPVFGLAVLALLLLVAVRQVPALRMRFGSVLGGVERASFGELYFPLGVAVAFAFAQGDILLYSVPVLLLTFADSAGALVGARFGRTRFQLDEGIKTVEGSLAVFAVAFACVLLPVWLFDRAAGAALLLTSLNLALLMTLFEAISWRGLDNLIVPCGAVVLLEEYLGLPAEAIGTRIVVLVVLLGAVIFLRRRTTLNDAALLAAALSGYALWAVGGWQWMLGPALLFAAYVTLPLPRNAQRQTQGLQSVTRPMFAPLAWLVISQGTGRPGLVFAAFTAVAAQAVNIGYARLKILRPNESKLHLARNSARHAAYFFLPAMLLLHPSGMMGIWIALTVALVAVSTLVFVRLWPARRDETTEETARACEVFVAFGASLPVVALVRWLP